jgi:hypothetical protein
VLAHIALVSSTPDVTFAQLAPVSAAIQKQVSRDFGPIWNVQATVDCFATLEDVPVGYWPVILQDELPNGAAGLHKRGDNKQPFALVALTTNWTVFMSHEVLEMLVDPQGNFTRAGNSLKSGQGRVEYLLEVCDPCQASKFAYTVNAVMVSDFYTPQYFEPVKTNARYSYSGRITGPRRVLDGGYLSWFDPQTQHLFQLMVDGKKETIVDKGEVPFDAESLRALSDSVSTDRRDRIIAGGSPSGMMLNADTDCRRNACVVEPILRAADKSRIAQAGNLRRQLEMLTKPKPEQKKRDKQKK